MKFGRLRYNRKINLVFLYIILILSIINLAVYPDSRSKYVHAESITYGATLYYEKKLELWLLGSQDLKPTDDKYSSNYENAYFQFEFEKNQDIAVNGTDEYQILLQPSSACSIVYINTSGTKSLADGTIKYGPYVRSDKSTVIVKCNVDKMKESEDQIHVSVDIKEKVNNEVLDYMSGSYTADLKDYYKKYPIPALGIEELNWNSTFLMLPNYLSNGFFSDVKTNLSSIPVVPDLTSYLPKDFDYSNIKNIDDLLKTWTGNIVDKKYGDVLTKYVMNNYTDLNSINSMPGLSINHKTTDKGIIHEFIVKDNLVGYARTALEDTNKTNIMYFSTTKKDILDEAFNYYLENYEYFDGSDTNKSFVVNYVNSFDPNKKNGIGYILSNGIIENDGTIKINGKTVGGMLYKDGRLDLSGVLDYAYIYNEKKIRISNGNSDVIPVFKYGLQTVYSNIMSEDVINMISTNGHPILDAVINRTTGSFTIKDKNNNEILVKVSSDSNYTYVTASRLANLFWTNNSLTLPEHFLTEDFFKNLKDNLESIPVDPKLTSYLPNDFNYSTVTNMDDIFIKIWLETILKEKYGSEDYNSKTYYSYIENYIKKRYSNVSMIENMPGLKVEHITNDTGDVVHTFEIEENLVGYAITESLGLNQNYMYFYTEDENAINKAFNDYVDNYAQYYLGGLDEEEQSLLKSYVDYYGGMANVINTLKNGQTIYGLSYNISAKGITLLPHIFGYANARVNGIIKMDFTYGSSMYHNFLYGLSAIYSNKLPQNVINAIAGSSEIRQAVIRNASDVAGDKGNYTERITVGNYIVVVSSTDGKHTTVTIENASGVPVSIVEENNAVEKTSSEELQFETQKDVSFESKNIESIDSDSEKIEHDNTDSEGSLVEDTEKKDVVLDEVSDSEKNDKIVDEDAIESSNDISNTSSGSVDNLPDTEVGVDNIPSGNTSSGIESISDINTPIDLS